jgi:hypothetical protein
VTGISETSLRLALRVMQVWHEKTAATKHFSVYTLGETDQRYEDSVKSMERDTYDAGKEYNLYYVVCVTAKAR